MNLTAEVSNIPCAATEFCSTYHYSDQWGVKLVNAWINAKRQFVTESLSVDAFRQLLISNVLSDEDLEESFDQGCQIIGLDADFNPALLDAYKAFHSQEVLNLIPGNLYAELCWVPGWTTNCTDDMCYTIGLNSDHYRSNYVEDVIPGRWLEEFLKMVNCGSVDLIGTAINIYGDAGRKFTEKCAAANFKVQKDQNRPQILTAAQVISAIENAYFQAVPMAQAMVNVKDLLSLDPSKPMKWSTEGKQEVHVGFHQPVCGAGYMDTYAGELIIPVTEIGFAAADRWSYGVDQTYGLYRPAFYTRPQNI
ncbi:hypothetical protein [Azonexus hydrophilus]|uniref:Uncharacterized protein n=1 Tax=Azonexus hydrophilus TaxID=418702 RepID=A0ABZ2XLC0_9RHOO